MKRIALVAAVFTLAACGPRDSDDRTTIDTGAPALMPAPVDTADTLGRDTLGRDTTTATPPTTP